MKLTEKHLTKRAADAGLALFPRYKGAGRIYDVCAQDASGYPDTSRKLRSGYTGRELAAYLDGLEDGQRVFGWHGGEDDDA